MAIKTGSENSAITRPTTVAVRSFREIELSIVGPERLKYTGGPVRSPRELVHDTALAVRLVVVNRSRTMPAIGHPQPRRTAEMSVRNRTLSCLWPASALRHRPQQVIRLGIRQVTRFAAPRTCVPRPT